MASGGSSNLFDLADDEARLKYFPTNRHPVGRDHLDSILAEAVLTEKIQQLIIREDLGLADVSAVE